MDSDSVFAESATGPFGCADENDSGRCLGGGQVGEGVGDELRVFDGFAQFAQSFDLTNSDSMIGNPEPRSGGCKMGSGEQIVRNFRGSEQGVGEAMLSGCGDDDS